MVPVIQRSDCLEVPLSNHLKIMETAPFNHDYSLSNSWCILKLVMQVIEGWQIKLHEQASWQLSRQWECTECCLFV
jgi:hypothetical protein